MNDTRWGQVRKLPSGILAKTGERGLDFAIGDNIVSVVDGAKEFELEKTYIQTQMEEQFKDRVKLEQFAAEFEKSADEFFGNIKKIHIKDKFVVSGFEVIKADDGNYGYLYIRIDSFRNPEISNQSEFQFLFPAYYFDKI